MAVQFFRIIDDLLHATVDNNTVMTMGEPCVQAYITIKELQNFLQTLEKAIDEEPNHAQQFALQRIYYYFHSYYNIHKEEHKKMLTEAPSGTDLEEYMLSYARSIKEGTV